jgi:hypothetical protein
MIYTIQCRDCQEESLTHIAERVRMRIVADNGRSFVGEPASVVFRGSRHGREILRRRSRIFDSEFRGAIGAAASSRRWWQHCRIVLAMYILREG